MWTPCFFYESQTCFTSPALHKGKPPRTLGDLLRKMSRATFMFSHTATSEKFRKMFVGKQL